MIIEYVMSILLALVFFILNLIMRRIDENSKDIKYILKHMKDRNDKCD